MDHDYRGFRVIPSIDFPGRWTAWKKIQGGPDRIARRGRLDDEFTYFDSAEEVHGAIDLHYGREIPAESGGGRGVHVVGVNIPPEGADDPGVRFFLDPANNPYLSVGGKCWPLGDAVASPAPLRPAPKGTTITIEVR